MVLSAWFERATLGFSAGTLLLAAACGGGDGQSGTSSTPAAGSGGGGGGNAGTTSNAGSPAGGAAGSSAGAAQGGSAGTSAGSSGSGGTAAVAGAGGTDGCQLLPAPESGAVTGTNWMTTPIECNNPTRREGLKAKALTHDWDVVFMGDSHTENWKWEGTTWGQYFNVEPFMMGVPVWEPDPGVQNDTDMANFGIVSDGTQHLLYRLQNGELDGLFAQGKPKIIALLIGANNVEVADGDELFEAIGQVIREIRFRGPTTRILLQGIFPKKTPEIVDNILYVNGRLGELADGHTVRYLDFSQEFLTDEGAIDLSLRSGDQVHLSNAGYAMWAGIVQPVLAEMLMECP